MGYATRLQGFLTCSPTLNSSQVAYLQDFAEKHHMHSLAPSKQIDDRVGVFLLRQMLGDQPIQTIELDLEELDTAHLLDRLTSETLHMHAQTCGPGPRAKPSTPKM